MRMQSMLSETRLKAPSGSSRPTCANPTRRGCSTVDGGDDGLVRVLQLVRVRRRSLMAFELLLPVSKAIGARRRRPRGIEASLGQGRRCGPKKSPVDARTRRQSMRLHRGSDAASEQLRRMRSKRREIARDFSLTRKNAFISKTNSLRHRVGAVDM